MNFLRKLLDKVEPNFTKGGRFERAYPVYEALDTFLYTPGQVTKAGSHVRDGLDMKRMMSMVVVALIPTIFMAFYNTGLQANQAIASGAGQPIDDWHTAAYYAMGFEHDPDNFLANCVYGGLWFLPVYFVCMAVGGTLELIFALVRRHEINEGFLVTGMLFPLTLPPSIPLWQVALGITFGVVIGKEIFGGTGKNFLNPALTARAFLYFAYPADISGNQVWTAADGVTAPTPLGELATPETLQMLQELPGDIAEVVDMSWWTAFLGFQQGSMGETSELACLLGAALLIATGIGSWRIMLSMLIGGLVMASVLYAFREGSENPAAYIPPHWHLVIGSFAFGAVYMATDPVSAAMTNTGKWWFGILCGVMTILIRVINPAYPEGVMLAILFANVMAPLIDYLVIQANVKRRALRYGT